MPMDIEDLGHFKPLLQRHIAVWRAKTVLAFDDGVLDDVEQVALASWPRPLRVAVDAGTSAEYRHEAARQQTANQSTTARE
jgi:hypothetical protein